MFNAPRPTQAYGIASTNSFGGSFVVDENPLAASTYDGLDPWSAAPSPSPPPVPSIFNAAIADATVPAVYHTAFAAVDPTNSGETSVNSLSRVLSTSGLPAGTVDKIVNIVSSRPRVSKLEFFVALALVALAQSGKDVSVEQVAALAQQNTLPEPQLDLAELTAAPSTFAYTRQSSTTNTLRPSTNAYASVDPWAARGSTDATGTTTNGASSSVAGNGFPRDWWKRQDKVVVNFLGQQGFILNRYMMYEIVTDRAAPVSRRYSEFVFLWDVLVRRYPFRLLPQLPPKRLGPDESFLEQRRKGLQRFLNFIINHPVIREDALLAVFLTEPSFETWRKQSPISYDEESVSKRIDHIEEMTIPSDLEEKLAHVKGKLGPQIEAWQKISILAERIIRKREAAAVRNPPPVRRFLSAHFALPLFSPSPSSTSVGSNADASSRSSIFSGMSSSMYAASAVDPVAPLHAPDVKADLSRLTNTLKALVEVNGQCWRGEECELSDGVNLGIRRVSEHTQRHTDLLEQRTRTLLFTTLEGLKSQRDLYIAMRDLYVRHDRLSIDQVERLKKRVDATALRLEGIKAVGKDGWQEEADRLAGAMEKDKATIAAQLNRRVFIRAW
ncbi:hypothetical protein EWM64_g3691 [Hericium alpestre]|uniref:Sorting nexin MVP1 n=1 Tax=Hericium alpestre TaxID=135208 RepID=A0A4Y9ZZQ6_9AGAM|nr:hypothetical protein EWM64_g3691 [Hericium alpestre]